ncbi:MAG: HNH endonuclease signature motif containing protein [Candidatus Tenebribacter davisii]|nr:HNH endonuclease signature motif containing protein [Candidatus Tenebribacter davisii]
MQKLKKVTPTQKEVRKLFSYNKKTGVLRWKCPNCPRIKIGDIIKDSCNGYLRVGIGNSRFYAHQIIWIGFYGYLPKNDIDHINRIKNDNRICNLRELTHKRNLQNTGNFKHNTSGIKGVYYCKSRNKWESKIKINQKTIHLDRYVDFDNAVCARLAAEQCVGWVCCDSPAYNYVKENIQ